jgi:hypothetical protein
MKIILAASLVLVTFSFANGALAQNGGGGSGGPGTTCYYHPHNPHCADYCQEYGCQ